MFNQSLQNVYTDKGAISRDEVAKLSGINGRQEVLYG